jgi:predicted TIM-barrel fold metal-dependent hydrolase
MWRNQDVLEFVEWLADRNERLPRGSVHAAGFYGIDLYSLHTSIRAVVAYLETIDKEAARRARAAGVRIVMVHVADPDAWFRTVYTDTAKYGTKADQYVGLERLLQEFPDLIWIGAHMGGDPEHADHLEALLERYPHYYLDTSAAKWQVREVSAHREAVRALMVRHPDRFLFGSDLVTRHHLPREHYVSRYWSHRTLWESSWQGRSPIADPDYPHAAGEPATPPLHGLELPADVLDQVYHGNAARLLPTGAGSLRD